jgi:SNF2 family DNA or RNA helicase
MTEQEQPGRIDLQAFEAQFNEGRYSKVMDNTTFERVSELRDRIADLTEMVDLRKTMMSDVEEQVADIEALEKKVMQFLLQIRERKRPFDMEKRNLRNDLKTDKVELERLQREWAKLMSEIEALENLRRRRMEIDHSTKDAAWRERALPHQLEGAHRMVAAGRALLGDKPGLGKTLQAIMTVNMLRKQGKAQKVLVFTLKPVLRDFQREFSKWYPGQFVHVLNQTKRGVKVDILDVIAHMDEAIVLTNYEVWRKDKRIIDMLKKCQFDTVVLDEAHVFKTKNSFTFRGIQGIIYAENKCSKCGTFIYDDSKSVPSGYVVPRTICPVCETRPKKFEDFRSVKYVYPMTGTPILNRPHDLWPMLNLIDVKAFPDESRFLDDYCMQKCVGCGAKTSMFCKCDGPPRWRWVFRDGGPERLLASLGMKFTSRNRDSAGVKMPPQEVKHHYFELDEELYPRYTAFTRELKDKAKIAFADGTSHTELEVLAWYTRVRQAATWPDGIQIRDLRRDPDTGNMIGTGEIIWPSGPEDLPGESIIMDEAEKLILEGVENGDRVIAVSMFKTALAEMERRLKEKNIRVARYDGDTPEKLKQGIIDDFNANHTAHGEQRFDVVLVNYRTGSTGLNLSGAQQIVVLDREWTPGKEEQMLDRVRRIDSQFNSTVHILHVEGTATDLMDAIQDEKKKMLDGFEADVNLAEAMRKFLEG